LLSHLGLAIGLLLWVGDVVLGLEGSPWLDTWLKATFCLSLLFTPLLIGRLWLQAGILARRNPTGALGLAEAVAGGRNDLPRVSIHVPCSNEPPDLVIATLESLAALDYPDYEVLVVDNNTANPALWHPVREYCAGHGSRFRFFHVDRLSGAKAGALNWLYPKTDPVASVIAIVDADYQAEPGFLHDLIPRLAAPGMAFVQAPHDYRDHATREFKRACYWEYMPFQKLELPERSEWAAGFTIGTLCVIDRWALESVGLWAEWCLTEDSELAVRLHAAGYRGRNLGLTYGRGLIPEDFVRYRQQRFRWSAGPVQQLKRHWHVLLPQWANGRWRWQPWQQLEWIHGLEPVYAAYTAILAPISVVVVGLRLDGSGPVALPDWLWPVLGLTLLSGLIRHGLVYQRLGQGLHALLEGALAQAALRCVVEWAGLRATFAPAPLVWRRTDKRSVRAHPFRAVWLTRWEIAASSLWFALAVWLFWGGTAATSVGAPALLGVFAAFTGLSYLAAPVMAVLGEWQRPVEAMRVTEPARR